MLGNQGLLAISFFESTAFIVLSVLFILLRRDHPASYFRLWLSGWILLTLSSVAEIGLALTDIPQLRMLAIATHVGALLVFLFSVMQYAAGVTKRKWPVVPLAGTIALAVCWFERVPSGEFGGLRWETAVLESLICLWTGWLLWRAAASHRGHGVRLMAGGFFVCALNGMDRPQWPIHPLFFLRVAFDHLIFVADRHRHGRVGS